MFRLDQHIEVLLLKHDCVIVPGFGGFVVHHIPAHLDESDGMMLPPKNIVGFNQQLTLNDSVLVQSYIDAYDLSYPEALREIEDETETLRNMIEEYGYYDICSIGRLSLNKNGVYEFSPAEAGILVPKFYGLTGIDTTGDSSFLTSLANKNEIEMFLNTDEEESGFIKISTSAIRNASIACAIIALLICIPFVNKNNNTKELLSMFDLSFFTSLTSGSLQKEEVPAEHKVYHVYVSKEKEIAPATTPETTPAIAEESNKTEEVIPAAETIEEAKSTFVVVLAARITQKNAEEYVRKLGSAHGMKDVRVVGEGKGRKVVCGNYTSEEDAQNKRRELFGLSEEFENAWVTQIN